MDSQAFEMLMSKMAEQKADTKEDIAELRQEFRQEIKELKLLVQDSRDFRMKLLGGSIGISALIGILWHLVELLTNLGGHG